VLESAGWRRPESTVLVKKGMAAKKATVTQKLESGVPAKIVVLRPSTITNRAWIYVASSAEHLAKWEKG
jgi:hypothetical protein